MKYLIITHFVENNLHDSVEFRLFDNKADALAYGSKDFEKTLLKVLDEQDAVFGEKMCDYVERGEGEWRFCLFDKHYYSVTLVELKKNKNNYFGCSGY